LVLGIEMERDAEAADVDCGTSSYIVVEQWSAAERCPSPTYSDLCYLLLAGVFVFGSWGSRMARKESGP
jgi:hypothetical protein